MKDLSGKFTLRKNVTDKMLSSVGIFLKSTKRQLRNEPFEIASFHKSISRFKGAVYLHSGYALPLAYIKRVK